MKWILSVYIALLFVFGSCEQASSRAPFAVTACSVEEGQLESLPRSIRIDLTARTDLASAVSNLVLAEDGVPLYCAISIGEQSIVVSPWRALRDTSSYRLVVSENLRSLDGQSLGLPFSRSFSLLDPGRSALQLDRFLPPNAPEEPLVMGFSAPVNEEAARRTISLAPDWPHRMTLEDRDDGGSLCTFEALVPWPGGTVFTLAIDQGLVSREGERLDREELRSFSLEEERPLLVTLQLRGADGLLLHDGELLPSQDVPTVHGIPPDFTLALEWDKPVALRSLDGALFLGEQPLVREGAAHSPLFEHAASAVLKPGSEPLWGDLLPLWVQSGDIPGMDPGQEVEASGFSGARVLAWLAFDDALLEPPRVEGLRYLLFDSENRALAYRVGKENAFEAFTPPIECYPLDIARPFAVEFFVFCAPGQAIDPVWFVEHVECRFDSAAFTLVLDTVRFGDFTLADAPEGFGSFWRCEFSGSLTNRNGRGLVSFEVPAGMPDRAGRRSLDRFLVTLCK